MMTEKKFGNAGRQARDGGVPARRGGLASSSSPTAPGWCPWSPSRTTSAPLDDDKGPNTGRHGHGLARHQPVPRHAQADHAGDRPAHHRRAWPPRGASTRACSTPGSMITDAGPRVLEFNARFGDPETQVIMARMRSDIVPILQGVAEGALKDTKIDWAKEPAVCVVLAGKGLSRRRGDRQGDPAASTASRASPTSSCTTPPPPARTAAGDGGRPRPRRDRARRQPRRRRRSGPTRRWRGSPSTGCSTARTSAGRRWPACTRTAE